MKKSFVFLLVSGLSTFCFSQIDSLPLPEAYFSALIVSDIDQSISWYSETLGFTVLDKTVNLEMGFKQANLKAGHTLVELIELDRALSLPEVIPDYNKKTKIIGLFKIGFAVSAFDQWIDHLEEAKVNFHGSVVEDNNSGKRMTILLDPDGNRIQIFEK